MNRRSVAPARFLSQLLGNPRKPALNEVGIRGGPIYSAATDRPLQFEKEVEEVFIGGWQAVILWLFPCHCSHQQVVGNRVSR